MFTKINNTLKISKVFSYFFSGEPSYFFGKFSHLPNMTQKNQWVCTGVKIVKIVKIVKLVCACGRGVGCVPQMKMVKIVKIVRACGWG